MKSLRAPQMMRESSACKSKMQKAINVSSGDEVFEKIKNYEFLSVDIFDTVLFRHCTSPIDAFDFMSTHESVRRVTEYFKDYRVAAENLAREDAEENDREDVSLEEIYSCFQQLTNCGHEQAEQIRQLELATEIDLLHMSNFGG